MKEIFKLCIMLTTLLIYEIATAQVNNGVFFTMGAGLIKSPGSLSNVLHPSIAFNSSIEIVNKKNWFAQGSLDFNTLKYDQRIKEDGSPYLFQNTSSSLFMAALSAGKNFHMGIKWLASLYTGGGYLNIGEPRLIDHTENSIKQEIIRKGNVFGKLGTRIGFKTKIKFLKTIYFDGSYWRSPLNVQGAALSGLSFFVGTRMSAK